MKKNVFILLLTFLSSYAFAQRINDRDYEYNRANTGYGAVTVSFTDVNHKPELFTGVYGGWFINQKVLVGAGLYSSTTNLTGVGFDEASGDQNKLRIMYGGVVVDYVFRSDKFVQLFAHGLVGFGGMENGEFDTPFYNIRNPNGNVERDPIFAFEPTFNAELKVAPWFRVGAGIGYRFITDVDIKGLSSRKLSGGTAGVTLKFGAFR